MRKKHRPKSNTSSRGHKKRSLAARIERLEPRCMMSSLPITSASGHPAGCTCPACVSVQDAYGTLTAQTLTFPSAQTSANVPGAVTSDAFAGAGGTSGPVFTGGLHGLSEVPVLNSLSGATATLYLDFNGYFEASWGGYSNITTPAYDQDGDATTFSDSELMSIQQIWRQVAEDYAPFNINVTTVEPPSFANNVAQRVVIGGDGAWTGGMYGGVSYVDSFSNYLPNSSYVFTKNLGNGAARYTGEAVSHESGHGFGLQHQSQYSGTTKVAEYYAGLSDGSKAPIMGNSYYATRGLWWNGPNSLGSTVMQDDMSVLSRSANGFGYRADDFGNAANVATALQIVSGSNNVSVNGVIATTSDTDWFSFNSSGGQLNLGVYTASGVNNLDASLQLRDANGNILASNDPTNGFDATLSYTLGAGQFFLVVGSHGSYGDVGQYTLMGTVPVGVLTLDAPSNLAANAVSTTQVNLTWTDNSAGETGFQVQYSTNGINWTDAATTPGNTTSYQVTGLTPSTAYQFRVRAVAAGVTSNYSSAASATTQTPTPPANPGNLTANAVAWNQINLAWSDNSNNETGFLIERSTDGSNWTQVGTTGANATSYQATGLAADTTYSFRVRGTNAGMNSGYTSTASATTDVQPTVPDAPSGLWGNPYGTKKVFLYWGDNADDEWGVKIQRSTNNGSTWTTIATLGAGSTSYIDETVAKSVAYKYRVIAYNDVGDSAASNVLSVTTPAAPGGLAAPSNLTAALVNTLQVNLTWQDNSWAEYGYTVQRSTNGGTSWSTIGSTGWDATSFTDWYAAANTNYTYRVLAFNDGTATPASNTTAVTTLTSNHPYSPGSLSANSVSSSQINLSWADNSGNETAFLIERSTDGANWTQIGTTAANATSYQATGLAYATTYYFRTRAANGALNSQYSNTASATTQMPAPPTAPGSLSANSVSTSQINLSWSDNSSDETAFLVEQSTDGTNWTQIGTAAANATSYQVTGLAATTSYSFRVRGTNSGANSTYTNTASATTQTPTAPTNPSGLTADAASDTAINLSWNDNSNNETGFLIERSTNGTNWTQIGTTAANVTTYQATGLAADTNYFFRVRGTNAGLNSGYTSTASATTLDTPPTPSAPSGLWGSAYGTKKIFLYWADNADNELGVQVQRSTNGGASWTTVTTLGPDATSYVDGTVNKSTTYQYQIVAYNDAGSSTASSMLSITTPASPAMLAAPSNLSATLVGTHQVNLAWQDNSWAEYGYTVQRSTNGGTSWTTIGTTGWDATVFTDWYTNKTTTYTYRVLAFNDGTATMASNKAQVKTLAFGLLPMGNEPKASTEGSDLSSLGQQMVDQALSNWVPAQERRFGASAPAPRVVLSDVTATQVLTASYTAPRPTFDSSLMELGSIMPPADPEAYSQSVDHAISDEVQDWL